MKRSEKNLWELVLSFHCGSEKGTQLIKFTLQGLYLLSLEIVPF